MKTQSKGVNKYPSREKYLANFAISSWLEERYKKVLASGDATRINRYQGMTNTNVLVEEPSVFDRPGDYFRSTIIARKNGLLFPDPKITFPTFDEFLEHIDTEKSLYNKEGIPNPLTLENLVTLVKATTAMPTTTTYALTKTETENTYALLVFNASGKADLDKIFLTVFDEYMFQQIDGEILEPTDEDYPRSLQKTLTGNSIGTINVDDVLLKEQAITIEIFSIKLIGDLVNTQGYLYDGTYKYDGLITYGTA